MEHWWGYVLAGLIVIGGAIGLGVLGSGRRSKTTISRKRPPPGSTGRS